MVGKFITLSIFVGIVTGIFITIYSLLTHFLSVILYFGNPIETISHLPIWYIYLVPLVSILIVNYLILKNEAVKEYGVREIAEAVEQNKLNFDIKDLFLKIFASSLSIASGFAIGNEGPSAAIGAIIAQKFHEFFKLPKKLIRVSLSIGASSGIAAIFVSPITGIMFAIENIAYEFIKSYAGYLILASVISFSVAWHFLEPLIFNYSIGKFIEYKYVFATILFIPVMLFFVYFYLFLKDRVLHLLNVFLIEKFSKYKNFILAVMGALIISTIMLISPYAVFSGHEVVKLLINNASVLPIWLIFIIIVLRVIATSISLYANAVGGIFIALMSIGALVGYGFGEIIKDFLNIEPFYFAAIGAAVFVGVNMKLPLTAVVLALEITYDYNVIIPTGISVVIVTYFTALNFSLRKFTLRPRIE